MLRLLGQRSTRTQCRNLSNLASTLCKASKGPQNAAESRRSIIFKMKNATPSRVCGYYVMFPVIPDETVENNTFLANIASNGDWPTLATSTPKEMYEGTVRSLMEYGATVMEHTEHLKNNESADKSFEGVLGPLLNEEYEVGYAFHTLMLKMMTAWPECGDKEFTADLHHIKITCAREHMEKLAAPAIQQCLKDLYENPSEDMDEWKLRLVEWYLLEIKASGLDKHDDKTRKLIGSWSRFVDEFRSKYLTNIMATNDQHQFTVSDPKVLKDAPPHILKIFAVEKDKALEGPWQARMAPGSILPFMQYCGDRSLRASAWEKWTSRASFEHDFYNNSINIEELRHNNDGWAKTLGYSSVSEHRLANKMAGTPETVRNFLTAVHKRMGPVFIDRRESWSKYAAAKELITDLQPYDLFYVCRREAEDHYDVSSLDLMNHFPFWETFTRLTDIVSQIFGLKFQDITKTGLEKCDPSCRIYSVADTTTGEHLGRLYIDPFDRQNKRGGWNTMLGRNQSEQRGLDKIVYMVGLGNEPNSSGQSLLHHSQLSQLLHHFGRSVQILLSKAPYRDITIPWAPMYASDWDAADLFPAFLQFFIYKPNLLQALSSPHAVNYIWSHSLSTIWVILGDWKCHERGGS
ncbi:hypothetical protein L596_005456 [Steinernema carpocapsae]|uniref:Peptidase M3A/M3B catalytic domain-containing protein n=1 Tax=Steinernema carpocapsae TaxID=34508 RepID=A0A4U8UZ27_STECR|nr:hypothetical protein L596_005456 [Steinernema carpocapsae]